MCSHGCEQVWCCGSTLLDGADELAVGVVAAVAHWCYCGDKLVVAERAARTVGVGPADWAEPVVAFDDDVAALAKDLYSTQAGPREIVVPHAGQCAGGSVGETQGRGGDVLDAVVTVKVLGVRAQSANLADQVAQHVDIVDAVLQQSAGPDQRLVCAPCTGVVALDWNELVVAKDDGHHAPGG